MLIRSERASRAKEEELLELLRLNARTEGLISELERDLVSDRGAPAMWLQT